MRKVPNKVINFIISNGVKHSGGEKFEWDQHRFMLEPIADLHPYQTHRKCAQIGFSESMIPKVVYLCRIGGLNVCYTMPSASDMDDFHKTKFGGIIRANPKFQEFIDGNSSKKIVKYKHDYNDPDEEWKERYIHLVGAYNSESASNKENTTKGISFTADALIHDESDRSDLYIIDQLQSRLLNSDYKFRWFFSNPTYPNVGTDYYWQESDQRHWMVRCPRCGHLQYLDWFRLDKHVWEKANHCYIDPEREIVICGGCAKELPTEARKKGEWMARYPTKSDGWHGYWYTQLMYTKQTIKGILMMERDMSPSVFANMVMGKPYIGADVTVTRELILSNFKSRATAPVSGKVAMGVDVRIDELQYCLMDEQGKFEYGRTKDWTQLEMIRAKWDAVTVGDAHPQTGEMKRFAENNKGKVWRAIFKPESDQSEIARFGSKTDKSLVLIRREEMFDTIADKYRNGQANHDMTASQIQEFASEWENIIRTTEEDARGNERPVWRKTGECDFPFAELYAHVAMMKLNHGKSYFTSPKRPLPMEVKEAPKTKGSAFIVVG